MRRRSGGAHGGRAEAAGCTVLYCCSPGLGPSPPSHEPCGAVQVSDLPLLPYVVRSGDLISYTAEEGVRILGEGKLLVSDSFPGNERNKYCLSSKV